MKIKDVLFVLGLKKNLLSISALDAKRMRVAFIDIQVLMWLEGVCKGCVKGKKTKKTFPSSKSKAKGILEIIHFDVCGPMSSNSLSEYVYYVSFIDDFF